MKTIPELKAEQDAIMEEIARLQQERDKLYGKVDRSKPYRPGEKEMEHKIADLFSKVNQIIKMKHKIWNTCSK